MAWELWTGGTVNYIRGPNSYPSQWYSYNVTAGGSVCGQTFASAVTLTTIDSNGMFGNISQGIDAKIPALDIINVSITMNSPNTTIAYARLFFNETYRGTNLTGELLLNRASATSEYSGDGTQPGILTLPPSPPGVHVAFYVLVYDTLGCTVKSPSYHYHTAPGSTPIKNHETFFYVVVFDVSNGSYVAGAPVTFSNKTGWIDHTETNLMGFAYPNMSSPPFAPGDPKYLALNQTYNVTVSYAGQVQTVSYFLTYSSNKTLTFYFNTAHQYATVYSAAPPVFTVGVVAGLAVAVIAVFPVYMFWSEMRRKAKEEEKRITL
jgi:hypothetical protein